ncbi:hypothetical protein OJ998_18445 [Solirubrobacter taibaiensis]|nr:hypothetical protein [Solirubrobacter taibaiensis]
MNELERALREAEVPDAVAARERARQTVLAAHRPVRRRPRLALVYAAIACAVAAVVFSARDTGPARAIERQVRSVFAAPTPTLTPTATTLPGRLLVLDSGALFVVRGGKRAEIGAGTDATWSPRGLFVAVARGRTLAAVEPDDGKVRWRLRRPAAVQFPRWAPGGLHIAYRSGGNLRIVYGNGQHDVLAGRKMAPVPAAWRPNEPRTVAWAAKDGAVTVEDADTAQVQWWHRDGPVRHLAWSSDGRRLLVAGVRNGTIHDFSGGEPARLGVPGRIVAVAFSRRLAIAAYDRGRTTVTIDGQTVLTAPGRLRDLEWSPDGRRLLAGWPGADHWLVVRGDDVAAVRHRFAPDARTRGWVASP